MSIKSVNCPRCRAAINVPASMASAKCQSCGNVFPIAAAGSQSQPSAETSPDRSIGPNDTTDRPESRVGQWLVVAGVAVAALVALILLTVIRSQPNESAPGPQAPMRTHATVVEELNLDPENPSTQFRVVKLPESTRQKIYRDYSQMIGSSFGKAKKIPQGGAAGQSLNKTLGAVVDREVTHIALINGITEDDVAQIYAEGQAKGW